MVYLGVKEDGEYGQDGYDIPKYPAEPPDRAHIWSVTDLEEPYDRLWYDIRDSDAREQIWNIAVYFYNAYCPSRVLVSIEWDSEYLQEYCNYDDVTLTLVSGNPILSSNTYSMNMKSTNKFSFGARAYKMYTFRVSCDANLKLSYDPVDTLQ
jgi:hypothetical protein